MTSLGTAMPALRHARSACKLGDGHRALVTPCRRACRSIPPGDSDCGSGQASTARWSVPRGSAPADRRPRSCRTPGRETAWQNPCPYIGRPSASSIRAIRPDSVVQFNPARSRSPDRRWERTGPGWWCCRPPAGRSPRAPTSPRDRRHSRCGCARRRRAPGCGREKPIRDRSRRPSSGVTMRGQQSHCVTARSTRRRRHAPQHRQSGG
jgi:hypothetical protein